MIMSPYFSPMVSEFLRWHADVESAVHCAAWKRVGLSQVSKLCRIDGLLASDREHLAPRVGLRRDLLLGVPRRSWRSIVWMEYGSDFGWCLSRSLAAQLHVEALLEYRPGCLKIVVDPVDVASFSTCQLAEPRGWRWRRGRSWAAAARLPWFAP
jgi:hypothetical protein